MENFCMMQPCSQIDYTHSRKIVLYLGSKSYLRSVYQKSFLPRKLGKLLSTYPVDAGRLQAVINGLLTGQGGLIVAPMDTSVTLT